MSRLLSLLAVFLLGMLVGAAVCTEGVPGGPALFGRERVAVIPIEGPIVASAEDSGLGTGGIAASTVVEWLRQAERDATVKAVVLRVNSPGGAVTPSDEIHNQLLKLKAAKPVVVSMGAMAASGGYYVSAPANHIVANPTSLTGSIGVIVMVPNVQGLLEKLGVSVEVFKSGGAKDATTGLRPLTETDRAVLQGVVDETYERFVQVVAEGRSLPAARVRELADGRVLTGRQAKEAGLVDELGDLPEAIARAGELGGIAGPPAVTHYRRPGGLLRQLAGAAAALLPQVPGVTGSQPGVSVQYLFVP